MVEFNTGNNTYEQGRYIFVNHKYYTEGHKQQLTPKELYILVTLRKLISTYHQTVLINLSGLSQLIPFVKHKQKSKNHEVVKGLLEALRVKDVISYKDPKDAHELIEIEVEKVKYIDGDSSTGYQTVGKEILNLTSDPAELYVLLVVRRFNLMDKQGEYSYPYYRNKKNWGSILQCDDRTAFKKINKMIANKLLYWYENTKEYDKDNEKWKQECGLYFIYPSPVHEARVAERDLKRKEYKQRTHEADLEVSQDNQEPVLAFGHKGSSRLSDWIDKQVGEKYREGEDVDWILELLNDDLVQGNESRQSFKEKESKEVKVPPESRFEHTGSHWGMHDKFLDIDDLF
ncbi:hypothetical protein [Brevibacillus agri]|uniref:hypothetical protein n=1 Tax=Brevibacillus agri TaxID=51101 RepID=UPI003D72675A